MFETLEFCHLPINQNIITNSQCRTYINYTLFHFFDIKKCNSGHRASTWLSCPNWVLQDQVAFSLLLLKPFFREQIIFSSSVFGQIKYSSTAEYFYSRCVKLLRHNSQVGDLWLCFSFLLHCVLEKFHKLTGYHVVSLCFFFALKCSVDVVEYLSPLVGPHISGFYGTNTKKQRKPYSSSIEHRYMVTSQHDFISYYELKKTLTSK